MKADLLLQLAEHLESGKLGHQNFDFMVYNADKSTNLFGLSLKERPAPYTCGTNGCAIGECPILWPDHWMFGENGDPELRKNPGENTRYKLHYSILVWFDLTQEEANHLFQPYHQIPYKYGGIPLSDGATKEQVASNIREFVQVKTINQK